VRGSNSSDSPPDFDIPCNAAPTRPAFDRVSVTVNPQHISRTDDVADHPEFDLDIPFGSLEAAAMAELPYTFRQQGTCTRYYQEYFG